MGIYLDELDLFINVVNKPDCNNNNHINFANYANDNNGQQEQQHYYW
jgi:hypothetical protein